MVSTPRQRNLCNLDRSDRKPLLWRLVNRQYHLRRNRRCRPPRQGNEKERRGGNPIPAILLTPAIYHQGSNVFAPVSTTLIHIGFPSFPTGPDILHSESMQPFSEISGNRGSFVRKADTVFEATGNQSGYITVKETEEPGKDGVQRSEGNQNEPKNKLNP